MDFTPENIGWLAAVKWQVPVFVVYTKDLRSGPFLFCLRDFDHVHSLCNTPLLALFGGQ